MCYHSLNGKVYSKFSNSHEPFSNKFQYLAEEMNGAVFGDPSRTRSSCVSDAVGVSCVTCDVHSHAVRTVPILDPERKDFYTQGNILRGMVNAVAQTQRLRKKTNLVLISENF